MYTSIEKNTEANMQSNPSIAQNVAIFQQIAETIGEKNHKDAEKVDDDAVGCIYYCGTVRNDFLRSRT